MNKCHEDFITVVLLLVLATASSLAADESRAPNLEASSDGRSGQALRPEVKGRLRCTIRPMSSSGARQVFRSMTGDFNAHCERQRCSCGAGRPLRSSARVEFEHGRAVVPGWTRPRAPGQSGICGGRQATPMVPTVRARSTFIKRLRSVNPAAPRSAAVRVG